MTDYRLIYDDRALECLEKSTLDDFYGLSYFQGKEGINFYQSTNKETFSIGLVRKDELIGIISGVIEKEKGIKSYYSRRAIIYGGPVLKNGVSDAEVGQLLEGLIKRIRKKVIYIETRNFFDYAQYKDVFSQFNFEYNPHLNFHLDTENEASVRKNISKSKLRDIKRSIKEGAEIVIAKERNEIVEYYQILETLYKTKVKTPLQDLDFFIKLFEQPSVKFILVKFQGEILGGVVCALLANKVVYEWFVCGIDRKYKHIYPSILATWAGIEYAFTNGYRYFDFMGAGKPDEEYGVREFKKSFGGALVEHGRFLFIAKPALYKLGKTAVSLLKKSSNFSFKIPKKSPTETKKKPAFTVDFDPDGIDPLAWNELNAAAQHYNVFQSREMFEFWNRQSNSKAFVCVIKDGNGKLLGLCSGVLMSTGTGLKKKFSRRAIIYGGPIVKDGTEQQAVLTTLLDEVIGYVQKKAIYLEIRNGASYEAFKTEFEKRFNYIPYQNFFISLKDEEAVFKNFTSEKRRQIRRALREGCEISYDNTNENLKGVYKVLYKTYREKVKKPLPDIIFFKDLISQNCANIIAVIYKDEVIGGGFFLHNDAMIYDWYRCGNDAENKHQYPSTLTAWGVMIYGLENKIKMFDFMGAGIRGEAYGVRKFKAQFGGELVEYGRYVKVLKPLLYKIGVLGLKYLKK